MVLISVFVISAIILSAQVNDNTDTSFNNDSVNEILKDNISDTTPVIDNSGGLSELDKIIRHYEEGNLYLSGDINFYADADSSATAEEKGTFASISTTNGSFYEFDSVLTVVNEDVTIILDKREKSIAVLETDPELKKINGERDVVAEIKNFKDYIYSIEVVNLSGNEKKLVIQFKDDAPANTSSYEIVYEKDTYQIKKIRMEIPDADITDVSLNEGDDEDELMLLDSANNEMPTGFYADIKISVYEVIYKTEKKADASLVDINRYVKRTSDGFVPAGAYANYELIN